VEESPPASPRAVFEARKGERRVYFDPSAPVEATIYERDKLDIGASVEGPCIIEQFDATTIVNPGWRATVDTFRNLVLARGA
jgi:N-methylhydantoinase A